MNEVKMLKAGKAAGPDEIPAEALKVDTETTADLVVNDLADRRSLDNVTGNRP
ncbi:unnamed protein product [Trichobilharzia regenti]|nr:unnamed protein product [Trichobilharzia regenti]